MIKNDNATVLNILGTYLNNYPNIIKEKNIKEITKIGVSTNKAFLLLFKNIFDIPDDLFDHYFPKIIKEEKIEDYQDNPYLKNVLVKPVAMNEWEIKYTPLPKYSGFVETTVDYNGEEILKPKTIKQVFLHILFHEISTQKMVHLLQ